MIIRGVVSLAEFQPEKMTKVTIAGGHYLFAGLNCFEPGQQHAAHVHDDQDKIYVMIAGEGEAVVGEHIGLVGPGDMVFAPSGVVHSLRNTSETRRLVAITVMGPPPQVK
jgi:mannose-6-phosphate isomerase-like protein (cupin superfamily)